MDFLRNRPSDVMKTSKARVQSVPLNLHWSVSLRRRESVSVLLGRLDASESLRVAERTLIDPELQTASELVGSAKIIEQDFTIGPGDADWVARVIRDDLHNVYEGIGFDAACNFAP
jgi:hypothetical protein